MRLNRVTPVLPDSVERQVRRCIGCCLAVHRVPGPGSNEATYARACRLEMRSAGLPFEEEKRVTVSYRGELVCAQRIDLFVDQQVVIEIKSVEAIHAVHVAQTVRYLKATGARIGLVINFNVALLKHGICRVVR